ncbi:MAG: MotA/TolQ/ExbB proton channel family protein [Acidobacteriota bacterium]
MVLDSLFLVAQNSSAHSLDIVKLFLAAGPVAKLVFGLLAAMSVASWAIMLGKFFQYRRAETDGERFLDVFRRSSRFSQVNAAAEQLAGTPMVGLFRAGYAEIDAQVKDAKRGAEPTEGNLRIRSLTGVERTLRRAISVELGVLSRGTSFLATTAASAPFIGLFGTVWGIMVAFGEIGATGNASLVVVAPGIAEALINTAAGLATAIPALVGFNFFGTRLKLMRAQMADFVLEFMNLTERTFT